MSNVHIIHKVPQWPDNVHTLRPKNRYQKQLKNRTVPLSGTGLLIELYRRIPAFNNPAVAGMMGES